MPVTILATGTSDSAHGGAILTFAFPVVLFVVVAVILYLLFSRPHRRSRSRRILVPAGPPRPAPMPHGRRRSRRACRSAAGGGGAESGAEPAGRGTGVSGR